MTQIIGPLAVHLTLRICTDVHTQLGHRSGAQHARLVLQASTAMWKALGPTGNACPAARSRCQLLINTQQPLAMGVSW